MVGNTRKLLIVLSIIAIQYCYNAAVTISNNNDLIDYVTSRPTESALTIQFAESIPSAERTTILNNSFEQLARQGLTQQITKLDLSENELTEPPVLTNLSSLKTLDLNRNQLIAAPMLTNLSAMQWLNLSDNQLTELPIPTGLFNLQYLFLENNQLKQSPPLTSLSSLQLLDLENNKLTKPPVLTRLYTLQWLYLANNPLTEPLYIPIALKEKLTVYGYTNLIYIDPKQELLKSLLTEKQIAEIRPYILEFDTESQAQLIAKAWLSQQDPALQSSATNIIFCGGQHLFFTQDGLEAWKQFKNNTLEPLAIHPTEFFTMILPLHSIHTLLTALYGNYDLDVLPAEDPITHTDFIVHYDEFMRLVQHFVSKYSLTPLTATEIDTCKKSLAASSSSEQQYLLKELARLIQTKKSPSPTQEFISSEDAIQLIQQTVQQATLPPVSDNAIANVLRSLTTAAGINRASLARFLESYIRSRTISKDEAIAIIQQTLQEEELPLMSDTDLTDFLQPLITANDRINSAAFDDALEQYISQLKTPHAYVIRG